jgi:hypothetical protein
VKLDGGATFAERGRRRLVLWRRWEPGPKALWLGLNPSTAGEKPGIDEDPTTRKIRGFSERMGCGSYVLMNLFDWCATDPLELYKRKAAGFPVSDLAQPDNAARILASARGCRLIVCAWGRHGAMGGAGAAMLRFLVERGQISKLRALGLCANGEPWHPLMVKYETDTLTYPWRRK